MSDSFHRLESIFNQAVEQLPGTQRRLFLDRECAGQPTLQRKVEDLLSVYERGSDLKLRLEIPQKHQTKNFPSPENYQLLHRLGEGGMGVVFLAEGSDALGRPSRFAVKMLKKEMDEHSRQRFEKERRVLTHLDHPYIVRFRDSGELPDGTPYLVMDHVEGKTIDVYCQDHEASTSDRVLLVEKVCEAVACAHAQHIIHRDLKPSNILVRPDGTPKLLDFGIAKVHGPEPEAPTSGRILTPEYASPEQLFERNATPASDVFSLGVLMFRLLTGRFPFERKDGGLEALLAGKEPRRPSDVASESTADLVPGVHRRHLRGDLDKIVLKALRRQPAERYPNAEALRRDLENYRACRPVEARRGNRRYVVGKALRRHRKVLMAILTFTIIASAFAWLMLKRFEKLEGEYDELQREHLTLREDLADLSWKDENYEQAEKIHLKMLRIRSRPEFSPHKAAEVFLALGDLYFNWNKLGLALAHDRLALQLFQDKPDADPALLGVAFNNIGIVHMELGNLDEALKWTYKALELRLRAFGRHHIDIVQSMGHMMMILGSMQRYTDALSWGHDALEVAEQVMGPDHERIPHILLALGRLYMSTDQVEDCETSIRRALSLRRRHLGHEHGHTALAEVRLGLCLMALGRVEDATRHLEIGLPIVEVKDRPEKADQLREELSRLQDQNDL